MSDRVGSLCTGYGGLDGAAEAVFGGELVWVADNDPHVTTLLAKRFPDVPNLGDITTQPDAESVDIVTAGFPCQPVSAAGRRKGTDDDRWIWNDIEAFIGRMEPRPRMLLLENVPGLLSANGGDAMARVVHGLASLGYVGRYGLLRAADVGACHRRERWFCVAHSKRSKGELRHDADTIGRRTREAEQARVGDSTPADPDGAGGWEDSRAAHGDERADGAQHDLVSVSAGESRLPTPNANDYKHGGLNTTGRRHTALNFVAERCLPTPTTMLADGGNTGRSGDRRGELLLGGILRSTDPEVWGDYAAAIAQHEQVIEREAPPPTIKERLNPGFVEWMMMLPEGWVTDLDLPRTAQLRILGNGVVPAQAAAAYSMLDPVERKERKNG